MKDSDKQLLLDILNEPTAYSHTWTWANDNGEKILNIVRDNKKANYLEITQSFSNIVPPMESTLKNKKPTKEEEENHVSPQQKVAYLFSYLFVSHNKKFPVDFWQFDLLADKDKINLQIKSCYNYRANFYKRVVLKNLNWAFTNQDNINHTDVLFHEILQFSGNFSLMSKIYESSLPKEQPLNLSYFEKFNLTVIKYRNIPRLHDNHVNFLKTHKLSEFDTKKFLKNIYKNISLNMTLWEVIHIHGFITLCTNNLTQPEYQNGYPEIHEFIKKHKSTLLLTHIYSVIAEFINNKLNAATSQESINFWTHVKSLFLVEVIENKTSNNSSKIESPIKKVIKI